MKKYIKMEMTLVSVENEKTLCSLSDWLEDAGEIYAEAAITTYQIES